MLSDNQYDRLRPHLEQIKFYKNYGTEPSTAPRDVMVSINSEIGNSPVDFWCGSCMGNLYNLMYDLIIEYELNK